MPKQLAARFPGKVLPHWAYACRELLDEDLVAILDQRLGPRGHHVALSVAPRRFSVAYSAFAGFA